MNGENHDGSIDVEFEGMPSIRLESFKSMDEAGMLERLAIATRRRRFSLFRDWQIELADVDYSNELNGIVEVPARDGDEKTIVFDGASIPMPWLVSLLTVGILRPLGVMLVGSIVHDYAYQYGSLRISKDGGNTFKDIPLSRHRADRLFRDIVGTVNRLPFVGYIAWFFVRIGWLWVRYNGKHFGGKPPLVEFSVLLLLMTGVWWVYTVMGLGLTLIAFSSVYVVLYIASIAIGRKRRRRV
ncbi:DUF1353 domain-containing protein [Granulosicoccus sp. 3-233]|uniref:DUF1353 domain-containing protein n=1 Tax=Granulosicoccus sp. 3-233 TaxID=3417969 RepID=UPI003D338EE4